VKVAGRKNQFWAATENKLGSNHDSDAREDGAQDPTEADRHEAGDAPYRATLYEPNAKGDDTECDKDDTDGFEPTCQTLDHSVLH